MRMTYYATRRKNSRLPRVQCARGFISPEAISPNFSSFAPMPIALGNIALFYPIPTLGEMALLSATMPGTIGSESLRARRLGQGRSHEN